MFTRAPWAQSQEEGGPKTPAGQLLVIPVVGSAARPTLDSTVKTNLKPVKGGKVFLIPGRGFFMKGKSVKAPSKKKAFDEMDFGSLSTNSVRTGGRQLIRLFSAVKRAFVKPRMEFRSSGQALAQRIVEEKGHEYFVEEYKKALENSK